MSDITAGTHDAEDNENPESASDNNGVNSTDCGSATVDSIISNITPIMAAISGALPAFHKPKIIAARYMMIIALAAIFAFWSLILVALCTHNDQVVRDLVIALASFLGGFATSRMRGED